MASARAHELTVSALAWAMRRKWFLGATPDQWLGRPASLMMLAQVMVWRPKKEKEGPALAAGRSTVERSSRSTVERRSQAGFLLTFPDPRFTVIGCAKRFALTVEP